MNLGNAIKIEFCYFARMVDMLLHVVESPPKKNVYHHCESRSPPLSKKFRHCSAIVKKFIEF